MIKKRKIKNKINNNINPLHVKEPYLPVKILMQCCIVMQDRMLGIIVNDIQTQISKQITFTNIYTCECLKQKTPILWNKFVHNRTEKIKKIKKIFSIRSLENPLLQVDTLDIKLSTTQLSNSLTPQSLMEHLSGGYSCVKVLHYERSKV